MRTAPPSSTYKYLPAALADLGHILQKTGASSIPGDLRAGYKYFHPARKTDKEFTMEAVLDARVPSTPTSDPVAALSLSEGEKRFYADEGYLVLPGLLSDESVARLREEVLQVMESAGMSRERIRQASGTSDKLVQSHQYLPGWEMDGLVNSPSLLLIAAQLMGGPSTLYLPFTAVKSGGGGGTFHFHQDNQYTRFDGPGINCWFALSDMTPENGCLQVVPRSHLDGTRDSVSPDGDGHRAVAQDPTRFLPVRMRAGDAIAFSRLTIHGSGPNTTPEARLAYAIQFHRNDVRATWQDTSQGQLLIEHPRWSTGPVAELSRPDARGRDGH
jgi:2-oxoglutarate-dependent dioxygenase